ncbi:MAG TPA: type II secretion system protein GspC [Gammaproteobacteria bacterium]|nr:type II secretion system protein GspC [Gammaproteobacteria bacterium]
MTNSYLDKRVVPFLQQQSPRLAVWVTGIIVLVIAYQMAQLVWVLFPPPVGEGDVLEAGEIRQTLGSEERAPLELARLHLFGKVRARQSRSTATAEEAPDTKLRLTLRGVVAAGDPDLARAIISEPAGEEKYYALDDKLPGGAVLKEIAADRVILQTRAGRMETLRLPKKFGGSGRSSSPTKVTTRDRRVSDRNRIVPRISAAELRDYRDKMLSNPQELVGLIRTRPVKKGGEIKGFKLFPGRDRALFKRLGLRSGDVIVSVNGMELNDPASGLALLSQLSSATEVSVVLERRGQRQTVTLSLEE